MGQNLLFRFSWKVPFDLILKCRIQESNSLSNIFSSSYSFLLQLVKNVLKNGSKFSFHIFSWKLPYNLILIWKIQKSNSFSLISFIYIFLFASISQKCLKKWGKFCFLKFSWKLSYFMKTLIWRIQKSNLFFQIFSSSSLFLTSTFFTSSSGKVKVK